ncbi:integrase [Sphingomonas faeni]|nr:integrase [Sphingomonas faeni]
MSWAPLPGTLRRCRRTPTKGFGRWLWLMIGTACRPEAALAFDPLVQWKDGLIYTHPEGAPRTKKHNPVVAAAPALAKMLDDWRQQTLAEGENSPPPKSRGRAWRTMRRALELPVQYIPKTIRHTVATELRRRGVPAEQISVLLGHRPADLERMTAVYAKYDPRYLAEAVTTLQALLMEVNQNAQNWSARHRREDRERAGSGHRGGRRRPATIVIILGGGPTAIQI